MNNKSINTSTLKQPLISICIPTFNRANCLANLLGSLSRIFALYGDFIQICISNNNSTDHTVEIIESWQEKLRLKVITQKSNIGATPNAIAVSKEATGKWIMLLGDDDELILKNFGELIELLKNSFQSDWIMVGVVDNTVQENMLGDTPIGRHNSENFRKTILRTGLYRFGFIGMHIFPNTLQQTLSKLTLAQGQPWPHLALLLRQLNHGHIQILSTPIVTQAAGGAELFWKAGDWAHANLRKLDIIYATKIETNRNSYFYNRLSLREIYSIRNIKNLIAWKIREPNDFSSRAFYEVSSRYSFSGYLTFLTLPHFALLLTLLSTPDRLVQMGLKLLNKNELLDLYVADKKSKGKFDGVDRGL